MAEKEQIEQFAAILDNFHPVCIFEKINEVTAGIGAVFRFLYESKEPVTAGMISSFMNVSTARVAVLLKKMEAKGYVIRETGGKDARTTVVRLSDSGAETVIKMRENMYRQIGIIIDRVGIDRLLELVETMKEIHSVMKDPPSDISDKK